MADACLTAIGVETTAYAVASHYGARSGGGVIDGWLVDEADGAAADKLSAEGIRCRAVPLWMSDVDATAAIAAAALELAAELRA
jgi:LPPG:FO 2-phospho-L-lactate transferase